MKPTLNRPVFLVGTHRSGTTWMGSLLGQVPEFAYWIEPRQVWSYGNYGKPDDVLTRDDASSKIKKHIESRFQKFAQRSGKDRFCEKTPSNCLRIPFMHEVFPDGKFILIIRDGRAVFRSTEEIKQKSADWNRVWSRITESSWKEFPAYFDKVSALANKFTGKKAKYWGVKPPGWKQWLDDHSSEQVTALQWSETISIAVDTFQELPATSRLQIRYEDLLTDTENQMQAIAEFIGIKDPEQFIQTATASVRPESKNKWRNELSPELLEEIRPIMEPTLNRLDYAW